MDSVGTTTGTSTRHSLLSTQMTRNGWPFGRKEIADGTEDEAIAVNHGGGLLNCTLTNDIGVENINSPQAGYILSCDVSPIVVSINVRNTGIADQSNFDLAYQLDNNTPVVDTYTNTLTSGQQVTFDFSETIRNYYVWNVYTQMLIAR